jgi:hypothetical protein
MTATEIKLLTLLVQVERVHAELTSRRLKRGRRALADVTMTIAGMLRDARRRSGR